MGSVETPGTQEVRLNEVCRSCLTKTASMINFYPKTDATCDIIAMLAAVGNFEIEINEFLPSYICKSCEEKLRLSYDFQLLIQRSNEIIRQCANGTDLVTKFDDESHMVVKADGDVADVQKKLKNKEVMRLSQVSAAEVEKAIKQHKEKFHLNITCIKCGFVSCNTRALSVHMTHLHKELKERWCSLCNSEVEVLSEHLLLHSEDLKCKFCGRGFVYKSHLLEHILSHSNVRPHKCHVCHKGFISTRHLNNHLKTHARSRLRRYKCDVCQKSFFSSRHLSIHRNTHVKNIPHGCPFCPQKFPERSLLRSHLRNHWQRSKMLECESSEESRGSEREAPDIKVLSLPQNFCKKCEKRVRSLTEHLSKHHQSSNQRETDGVLCTTCGKKFKSASKFRIHMRTHTGEAPYQCSYCDKRTSSRNQLVVHERTHTGEKPHICNICGKGFAQSSVLNTHMKLHTGRPEVCDICSKRFCRPAQLRLHMRKHTGEKPFQCTECEQAFKQKSHLTEHLKTHSDERPYRCPHCEKGFKQSSSLKSHVQIHLGTKPFKCSQCPYACRQSYSLTQHMRQHSIDSPRPEKPHVCSVCQKGFSTVAMLTSHVNVAHSFL